MGGNVVKNILSIQPGTEVRHLHQNGKIIKTRYVDEKSNHMFLRVDEGDNNTKPFTLTKTIKKQISQADAVIVSDYNKGFLTEDDIYDIILFSKICFIDTKKTLNDPIYTVNTFYKLNEEEYNKNKMRLHKDMVVVTLGSRGAKYMDVVYPSPNPQQTMDVSGAGDTFMASFVMYYMINKDIPEAIKYANTMCSIVVGKKGVAVPIDR